MNKLYILFLISIIGGLVACDDLDRFPKDSLSPETYFSSAKELQLYTNQFYELNAEASDMYGEFNDLVVKTGLIPDEIAGTRIVPTEGSGWTWDILRHINYYLQHSSNCTDESALNHYDGVAYFFRALFYFEKVKRFGDVPWYDQPIGSDDEALLYKARDTREYVIERVIIDLDKAIDLLPETHSVYEVNKWTALALKSRICLFEGTFRKYHGLENFTDLLGLASDAALDVIKNGGYQLYKSGSEPYRDLFASLDADADEVILARAYSASLGVKHNANNASFSASQGCPGFTKRFVNLYLNSDGSRFTDKTDYDKLTYAEETQNRDPRMAQTILCPGYIQKGETSKTTLPFSTTVSGYRYIKYVMQKGYDGYNASVCDMPLFRLAEVYLNFAEAKAELGTFTQTDADMSINKLRDRVGMPNLDVIVANQNPDVYLTAYFQNVTQSSSTGVILEIRRERIVELALEGFHYYDMMRWKEGVAFTLPFLGQYFPGEGKYDLDNDGKIDLVLYKDTKPIVFGATFLKIGTDIILSNGDSGNVLVDGNINRTFNEERDYLFPIPINDRVLTNGILTQNPGWNDGLQF